MCDQRVVSFDLNFEIKLKWSNFSHSHIMSFQPLDLIKSGNHNISILIIKLLRVYLHPEIVGSWVFFMMDRIWSI